MPITFSHPAIVLPAKYLPERWVSMTGLIVGSITPDFEYFIRMKVESIYSHTLAGMFWFDLPLAFLLTFLYHNIIRNPFIYNAPAFLRKRLFPYRSFNWPNYFRLNYFRVIICLLIGIASHIFWDAFTHPHGDFVRISPLLRGSTLLMGYPILNSRILQYVSTIVGALIVFYAVMRMPQSAIAPKSKNQTYYWLIVIGIALIATNLRIWTTPRHVDYYAIGPSMVLGLIIGSVIAPLLLPKKNESVLK